MDTIVNQTEQIIHQVILSWEAQNKAVTSFFQKYEDASYYNEIAPNRNRAVYLLGHLVAVNDGMLPLFGLGNRLFPNLEAIFIKNPDKQIEMIPSVSMLREYWETLNVRLSAEFNKLTVKDWLDKHNSVSAEDFALNPLRNKLNVLLGRTNHQSYHLGQINLLYP